MEQKGVVAAPSQWRAVAAPALPRSNQTEATLVDEGRNDTNGELLMKRILLGAVALVVFAAPAAAADLQARPRPYTKAPAYTDRKSTRLNSSHDQISYAVFCLKKKKKKPNELQFEEKRKKKKTQ